MLVRQLIIKPIDALTFEPGGPSLIRTLLAGRPTPPSTADHKFMFYEHSESSARSDYGCRDLGDAATGRLADWACRHRRKACALTTGEHNQLTTGKRNDVNIFDLRISGLPCRCSIPRASRGTPSRAHEHVMGQYSGARRSFVTEPAADDLSKAPMVAFYRGERW